MNEKFLNFTAIDFETGNGNPNSVCQVGLVKVENGVITDEFSSFIKPPNNFIRNDWSETIHKIYPEDTANASPFKESYSQWKHFVENQVLVAHNAAFDMACLNKCLKEFCDLEIDFKYYCTFKIWRGAFEKTRLDVCCKNLGIPLNHHEALSDARACAKLFLEAVKIGRIK
jgi:DNA polymerase-3 subunit epsilon